MKESWLEKIDEAKVHRLTVQDHKARTPTYLSKIVWSNLRLKKNAVTILLKETDLAISNSTVGAVVHDFALMQSCGCERKGDGGETWSLGFYTHTKTSKFAVRNDILH